MAMRSITPTDIRENDIQESIAVLCSSERGKQALPIIKSLIGLQLDYMNQYRVQVLLQAGFNGSAGNITPRLLDEAIATF